MNTNITIPKGVRFLGDPHLGKKFLQNVPLDKRGKREEAVRQSFISSYLSGEFELHICVGDLFDKFRVDEETIIFAYNVIRQAATAKSETDFVILQGNHDASRDETLKSSFSVLKLLCEHLPNVHIISSFDDDCYFSHTDDDLDDHLFVLYPWMPFHTAKEVVEKVNAHMPEGLEHTRVTAVGHWDVQDFSGISEEHTNMIPYDLLSDADQIVTGHYHNKGEFIAPTKVPVKVTGSMQPYSHSEDPENAWYITLPHAEVLEALESDPKHFEWLNLRVLLTGEELPLADINCLSLVHKKGLQADDVDLAIEVDTFSIEDVFKSVFDEYEVPKELTEELWVMGQENTDA